MKKLLPYLIVGFAAAATAFAEDVTIFMPDTTPTPGSPNDRQIRPDVARLVLARRLGWPGSSLAGHVDESILQDLNEFGGQQPTLFGDSDQRENHHKLLVVVQGFDPVEDAHTQTKLDRVRVAGAERDFMETTFLSGLLSEPSPRRPTSRVCSYQWEVDQLTAADLVFRNKEGLDCPSKTPFVEQFMNTLFEDGDMENFRSVVRTYFGDASPEPGEQVSAILRLSPLPKHPNSLSTYKHIFPVLALAETSIMETTVVALPGNTWKTSAFTNLDSAVQPLADSHKRQPSQLYSALPRDSNSTKPDDKLSTLLPICYATNETCNARTNSCSGHGYCYLKRQGAAKGSECYACRCLRTVDHTNSKDGSKETTQWGGPACQKKDVSMPFWLLGGFTLLLVVSIWLGVGLLWQMGQEELPSVLSAGVAAPRTQK
ncbi:hypothetical protein CPC735_039310 [Coccidioides posadasii C735 delta SOWgp]|uniref:Vacuolar sorting protein Vps3844 C-terminal domain-containing protein n=1 Tax=Coccidioides posadasii (strain C735) TaxID=222929 RepID=C5P2X9_COCP7|nr:hypothetical protein CPC735_039310 [Coccidioides posadasii C735 delta SOWgp]EER28667.1 hypothetical protein CPC735_039310 [Coccidioides posadasii C735 delta SOWgp]|eukprot:XP_003070812.1 hypothetical protein CPC735_039310 [Coccidioides posadasii C735 delta SOWgp]